MVPSPAVYPVTFHDACNTASDDDDHQDDDDDDDHNKIMIMMIEIIMMNVMIMVIMMIKMISRHLPVTLWDFFNKKSSYIFAKQIWLPTCQFIF